MKFAFSLLPVAVCLLSVACCGMAETMRVRFPAAAGIPNIRQPPYNAKGDGTTDDTTAFQKALLDDHALIYIPDGIYIIADTLRWGASEKRQVLQGESQDGTVIKLLERAGGYQNPTAPKPMIWTGKAPAQRFRNGLRNLTLDTGKGNPGAIGAQFIANNQGGITQVTFRDSGNCALIGLDLGYTDEQGPCLIRGVVVEGFETGISCKYGVDSVTFERINLVGQRKQGIRNDGQCISLRKVTSLNVVPALVNLSGSSLAVIVDSVFQGEGAAAGRAAIENGSALFARNIDASGYARAITNTGGHEQSPEGVAIKEFVSHGVLSLFRSPPTSLNLPVKDTPEPTWDPPEKWVSVADFGPPVPIELRRKSDNKRFDATNWAPALQRAIDSGASTIYFPRTMGKFGLFGTIHVRANVRHIFGCESTGYTMSASTQEASMFDPRHDPVFSIEAGTAPTVTIERFDTWYMPFSFQQRSARTLVVRSLSFHGVETTPGSGDVFLEDVRAKQVTVRQSTVYARQINPEGDEEPRLLVDKGTLWILGLKTEGDHTIAKVVSGGALEVVGGFIYANKAYLWPKQMFINEDSNLSVSVGEGVTKRNAPFNQVIEVRNNKTNRLAKGEGYSRGAGAMIPLYVGRQGTMRGEVAAPRALTALKEAANGVLLTWEHKGENTEGFEVEILAGEDVLHRQLIQSDRRSVKISKGLLAGKTYRCRVTAYNAENGTSSETSLSLPSGQPAGQGTGLQGAYFRGEAFDELKLTRTDPAIDFTWGSEAAAKGLHPEHFSIRWTGQLTPRFSDDYRFTIDCDDAARLWIGGELVVDAWMSAKNATGRHRLEAGVAVPVRVDYVERGGGANIKLSWQSANEPKAIIPASQLTPDQQALPAVHFTGNRTQNVKESGGTVVVTLARTPPFDTELSVPLQVTGTGVHGIDFQLKEPHVQFAAGQEHSTTTVTLIDNPVGGPDRSLVLMPAPRAAYIHVGGNWTLAIADDDMPPSGNGTGLYGTYYAKIDLTDPKGSRIDPSLDFTWGKASPFPGLQVKGCSAQWRGQIQPLFSEVYAFDAQVGKYGGIRVRIDGRLVIDRWDTKTAPLRGILELKAGRKVDIEVSYFNLRDYGASAVLNWSSPSQYHQPIPSSQLYPPQNTVP